VQDVKDVVESEKDLNDLDNLDPKSCHWCEHASKELARVCGACVLSKDRAKFKKRKRMIKQKEIKDGNS
jgi:hypothetical protein